MSNQAVLSGWDTINSADQLDNITENIVNQFRSNPEVTEYKQSNCEFVNAVVFNEAGDALIIEVPAHTQPSNQWSMIETMISDTDDPLTAVKDALLEKTGYSTSSWSYIGTYLNESGELEGAGHIFVARAAKKSADSITLIQEPANTRWVSVEELRYALLDGRILSFRYALNVALALLTVLD